MLDQFELIPINCVWAQPDDLISEIAILFRELPLENWIFVKGPLDLKTLCFPAPPKGGAHAPKLVVWRPVNAPSGSVLVANYKDGMIQLMRHLNRRFRRRIFHAVLSNDHRKAGYCSFLYCKETGEQRAVYVIRDPTWKFFSKGEAQSFEEVANYGSAKIAERLTPTMVVRYLKALGWHLQAPEFWVSDGGGAWIGNGTFM